MYPAVRAALAQNRGLITTARAQAAGLSAQELRTLVRQKKLVVVRRGVYAEREVWDGLDEYRGRPLFRARAAHLTMVTPHTMSHDSAALELDLSFLRQGPELVHVTRPDVRGSRTRWGVKHHTAKHREDQVVDVDGIDVLDVARTAIDLGREHGFQAGVVACDAARRRGISLAQLRSAHEPMDNWRGIRPARQAVEYSDPGAENAAESLGRILVGELGIGAPETQFPVRVAGHVYWCDLRVGCHLFEVDGRIKYQRIEDGGVAERPLSEVIWEEKKRERAVCGVGLGMSRIIWEDFFGPARDQARARLRAEWDLTVQRFGTVLPESLAREAHQLKGLRRAV